jgi:hypothetical protein
MYVGLYVEVLALAFSSLQISVKPSKALLPASMYMDINAYIHMRTSTYICMSAFAYICMSAYAYMYMSTRAYIYDIVHMHTSYHELDRGSNGCIHVCTFIFMYSEILLYISIKPKSYTQCTLRHTKQYAYTYTFSHHKILLVSSPMYVYTCVPIDPTS